MERDHSSVAPYVPAESKMPEFTWLSFGTGLLLLFFFGAANAYLGLKVGMTVSASIPAAVASMALLRGALKKGTILENNMVQTIASTGEAMAAGVVFSVPALFMLDYQPTLILISLIALFGGVIGITAMVIFRRYLIVQQHDVLNYPEGKACAEILIAGDKGGVSARQVFYGGLVGAVFRFVQSGFMLFPELIETPLPALPGGIVGMNALPALGGVGYLIGIKIAGVMLAGGFLAWLVVIPLLTFVGQSVPEAIFPAAEPISKLGAWGIWENYIQYIGAGVLTVGGIFEFAKALPVVADSLRNILKALDNKGTSAVRLRTDTDLSGTSLILLFLAVVVAMALLPQFPVGILGAAMAAVFGFLFVSISSRIVGVVGSSSNPVSGMTIATIFFSAILFRSTGHSGPDAMITTVIIGSVVTVAAAVAGDISQDLKTGFLVGATPRWQQIGELLSGLAFAGVSSLVLVLLHNAYVIGSPALPAPATSVIAVLVRGIFEGYLPWGLLIIGAVIGLACELMSIPSLPFAIGFYLPIHLTVPIFCGGIVRQLTERGKRDTHLGVLYASGLVAGDATIGIVVAILTTIGVSEALGFGKGLLGDFSDIAALCSMLAVLASIYCMTSRKNGASDEAC